MNAPPYLISAAVHMLVLIAATLPLMGRHREPSLVLLEPAPTAARQVADSVALDVQSEAQVAADTSVASRDDAVGSALAWLVDVQHADGGWSQRREPADVEFTATALLAFASAHQTHKTGRYADAVKRGLQFLVRHGEPQGGSPPTGLRFPARSKPQRAQALATLALATHYSRTHDKGLAVPLQLAVNELCDQPITNQDTAEDIGWRFLALKEAHMAYLQVPVEAIQSLKSACDGRALTKCEIEPGVLLARLTFSLTGAPAYAELEHLKEQCPRGQSPAESYFLGMAVSNHRQSAESIDCLRLIQRDVLETRQSREPDVEQVSLRIMILQLRPPRHVIFGSSAAEDDFPL